MGFCHTPRRGNEIRKASTISQSLERPYKILASCTRWAEQTYPFRKSANTWCRIHLPTIGKTIKAMHLHTRNQQFFLFEKKIAARALARYQRGKPANYWRGNLAHPLDGRPKRERSIQWIVTRFMESKSCGAAFSGLPNTGKVPWSHSLNDTISSG